MTHNIPKTNDKADKTKSINQEKPFLNQSVCQLVTDQVYNSTKDPLSHSISQQVYRSVNRSVNQSMIKIISVQY